MVTAAKDDCWATFRESANPMVLVDENRRVIEVNPALRALTGRTLEDTVGRPIIEFVPPGDRDAATKAWDAIQSIGYAVDERRITTASGETLLFHYAAVRHQVPGVGSAYLAVAIEVSPLPGREIEPEPLAAHVVPGQLTPREDEIVRLVALGRTNNEIAEHLHLSPETVRSHIRNAMEKTGARNRAHLVATQYAERLSPAA